LFVRVLGSAAGGGFPQWNCGCANCSGLRAGRIAATARTQESVAVSADGDSWFLLNASPEIRQQIEGFAGLHPKSQRHTPIAGVILTSGDLDHCLGLLSLRESQSLVVYATERVRRGFAEDNGFYRTLERFPGQVTWRRLLLSEPLPLSDAKGQKSGLTLTPFSVPGKAPLHDSDRSDDPEHSVGLRIESEPGAVLAYLSGVAGPSSAVDALVRGADAVFFDGTFWASDELIALGIGTRSAEDMAHWRIGGAGGSLEYLRGLSARRRVFIHINNTNPMLRDDSAERKQVQAAGVEVGYDGMEFQL
jgi:pyrroloquinoline quinone biosynthesis protein B